MRFIPRWLLEELYKVLEDFQEPKSRIPLADRCQKCSLFRASVLICQIGDLAKADVHRIIFGDEGVHGERKIALADTFIQYILLSRLHGYDINELIELGFKRIKEKSKVRRS